MAVKLLLGLILVPLIIGCAVDSARPISEAQVAIYQATVVRNQTRDALDDQGTQVAVSLQQTRVRSDEVGRQVAWTATANVVQTRANETVSARRETRQALESQTRIAVQSQSATVQSAQASTRQAEQKSTQVALQAQPTLTAQAQVAEDAERRRQQEIQLEQSTADLREWTEKAKIITGLVITIVTGVVAGFLAAYGLYRVLLQVETWIFVSRVRKQVVLNQAGQPVLLLMPPMQRGQPTEWEILDPKLLPEPAPTLPYTENSDENRVLDVKRAGEVVDQIPVKLVHGFDTRDLHFLCRLLARGYKHTEASMELLELPYSREMMGKAQPGSHYTRFMWMCQQTEVIVGRGGNGNKSGKVIVTDPNEMMKRFRELSEAQVELATAA